MSYAPPDFFSTYFTYAGVAHSESPATFHRWACMSMLGALLGRQVFLPFGHSLIYPNQYIMLMGSPGSRKSSAIGISKRLLTKAGYTRFSSDRTSKERFLIDMRQMEDTDTYDREGLLALTLDEPAEIYVVAGEFTDFVGNNNMEFITMLTNLWDNLDEYKNPKIHGASVVVNKPTINILGGNTVQGFSLAFPAEALGNGFLSRIILVHGEGTGKKITWPAKEDKALGDSIAEHLIEMRSVCRGEILLGPGVESLGDLIYGGFIDIDDNRFKYYGTRRFSHLLKIATLIACSELTLTITEEHILKANTLLHYTEIKMPKALGEFGKSKYSDVANSIVDILAKSHNPVTLSDLWKKVNQDLNKITELADIIKNLEQAGKIQVVSIKGKQGFLLRHEERREWKKDLLVDDWLTEEEKM